MFNQSLSSFITAAVASLIFSATFVVAAVGPAEMASSAPVQVAQLSGQAQS